jgi:prepilin-type N-terminal cleavage/methylation domain-containing protein
MRARARRDGFTLIEVLVAIAAVSILAGAVAPLVVREMNRARLDDTSRRMVRLIDGMVGGSDSGGFGYVGDMGGLPATLEDLRTRGSQTAFSQTGYGFGVGWNGPYVREAGPLADITEDAWGTAFSYSSTQAQVQSAGPDHVLGNGDDLLYPAVAPPTSGILTVTVLGVPSGLQTTIPLTSSEATVSVTISDSGSSDTVVLAGSGPFYTASAIHVGIHAIVAQGLGSYSGVSGTEVIEMSPGNTAVTVTLVQP